MHSRAPRPSSPEFTGVEVAAVVEATASAWIDQVVFVSTLRRCARSLEPRSGFWRCWPVPAKEERRLGCCGSPGSETSVCVAWKKAGMCVKVAGLPLRALVQAAREEMENWLAVCENSVLVAMGCHIGFEWVLST